MAWLLLAHTWTNSNAFTVLIPLVSFLLGCRVWTWTFGIAALEIGGLTFRLPWRGVLGLQVRG